MVGLGSIGQRHLRNIIKLRGNKDEIIAYRVKRSQRTFSDDMKIRDGVSLEKEFNISAYSDLHEALNCKPDIAFITNITSKHVECALSIADAGCDIFMEKPLSDGMVGVQDLKKRIKEKGIIFYMGYQNRFHPCISDIKQMLSDIGDLISVDNEFGERLSTIHTYENYHETYLARRKMGGGAVLNLQIHALDYLQNILGKPFSVFSISGNNSDLDVDVEDFASSIYSIKQNNSRIIPVYSHTDFLQYPPIHTCKFVGTKGWIKVDLNKAVTVMNVNDKQANIIKHTDFIRNDMFLNELNEFFYCVQRRIQPDSNIDQGIIGLKMALMEKKSAETGTCISWEDV